jgi:beta-glucosidase
MDLVKIDPSLFPGVSNAAGQPEVIYKEGLNMGYRWYDANGVAPAFPFGHGLSYTTFEISKLEVTPKKTDGTKPIKVRFVITNTGSRKGAEVAQVYLGLPGSIGEPPKRLVAFKKVWLNPGEKKNVRLLIDPSASNHPLGYWDSDAQNWAIAVGDYGIFVGNSAANIVLKDTITVRGHLDDDRGDQDPSEGEETDTDDLSSEIEESDRD